MTHLSDEDLVMAFYHEPEFSGPRKDHLAECELCRRNFDGLKATLQLVNETPAPEPPSDWERAVWARLAPALEDRRRPFQSWLRNLLRPRVWLPAAALATLIIGAFLAGRGSRPAPEPVMAGLSAKARERILVISLADHLERAGLLLTDVSNSGESGGADLQLAWFDRDRASDLLSEGRLLEHTILAEGGTVAGNQVNQSMLDELDRLLMEIANAPDRVSASSLRLWRERIDSGALLFKVRVAEANFRAEGQRL